MRSISVTLPCFIATEVKKNVLDASAKAILGC